MQPQTREISSVGSEHLVYTEGVGGSNPSFPTKRKAFQMEGFFVNQMYSCYILHSLKLDSFYVGESDNVSERLKQHNSGFYQGSFTAQTTDWTIFVVLDCNDRAHARRVERHIKAMKSKEYIRNLHRYPEMREKLILRFDDGSGSR